MTQELQIAVVLTQECQICGVVRWDFDSVLVQVIQSLFLYF